MKSRLFIFHSSFSFDFLFYQRKRNNLAAGASGSSADMALALAPMTPEQQKRKLNLAVSAIMHQLDLPEQNRADVRSAYVIAEDLALRQAEIIYQLPLLRHRVLEGVPFDAVALKENQIYCVEVEFLTAPEFPSERLAAIFDKIDYANQRVKLHKEGAETMLMLILITQLSPADEEVFHRRLEKQIRAGAPVEIDAPIFNFEQLQFTFLNE